MDYCRIMDVIAAVGAVSFRSPAKGAVVALPQLSGRIASLRLQTMRSVAQLVGATPFRYCHYAGWERVVRFRSLWAGKLEGEGCLL